MRPIDDPFSLTPDERLTEVASIFAAGILCLHARAALSCGNPAAEKSLDSGGIGGHRAQCSRMVSGREHRNPAFVSSTQPVSRMCQNTTPFSERTSPCHQTLLAKNPGRGGLIRGDVGWRAAHQYNVFWNSLLKVCESESRSRIGSVGLSDWQTDATTDTISEKVPTKTGNETDTP